MNPLGEKIKSARLSNGYTQLKLAELINVSVNTITRWEHNRTVPSSEDLLKLAKVLDYDFVSEEETEKVPTTYDGMQIEDLKLEIVSAREMKNRMIKIMFIVAIIIIVVMTLGFILLLLSMEKIDPNSEDQPVRVIEYYYAEEGRE